MDIEQEARGYFNSGFNCAESMLLALSKQPAFQGRGLGNLIPRVATGFGGGLARNGSVCGALAGAAMAIGLALGRDDAQASRDPCYPAIDRLISEFQERFYSSLCRDISRVDMKTEEGRRRYQMLIHNEVCNPVVAWTARRANEIIGEYLRGTTGLA
jgi:C_GCAxxG_C_C family probable redox protein